MTASGVEMMLTLSTCGALFRELELQVMIQKFCKSKRLNNLCYIPPWPHCKYVPVYAHGEQQ